MNIAIITIYDGFNRGEICDFFPIIKWRRKFKQEGVHFRFFRNHLNKHILDYETVFIDHRYYQFVIFQYEKYKDTGFLIEFMNILRANGNRVIFFDHGDRPNSEQWHFIEHCDLFVKKQLFKNRKLYTKDRGFKNKIEFTDAYDLSDEQKRKNHENGRRFKCCPKDQAYKIQMGWSIGMYDYREFPFTKYYPFGKRRLLNSIYKLPKFTIDFTDKDIDSSFRGDTNKGDENYAWQRNQVIKYLRENRDYKFKTGKIIPKKQYWLELRKSKTCLSPFGHGEICYRDFEAIIAGCVLIKPDMDHIDSYPNVYIKNETYVDLQWDLENMREKVEKVIDNYDDYKDMVRQTQKIYKNQINSFEQFFDKFKYLFS